MVVDTGTYLKPLEIELETAPSMKFRLTYEGELRPTGRDPLGEQENPLAPHKHAVRRVFHKQLQHLWKTDLFLSRYRIKPDNPNIGEQPHAAADSMYAMWSPPESEAQPLVHVVAARHKKFGYQFVPLVTRYFHLLCSIHVLFLRHDVPGSAIQAGDIDNRIKTLIDALRLPNNQTELVGSDSKPCQGETTFFCLLEDDNLVSGFSVETDTLLNPPRQDNGGRDVKVVVTVELRPYFATTFNLSFV